MYIKLLSCLLFLSSANAFCENHYQETTNETESFSFCIKEDQKVDTTDWIIFPLNFTYAESDSQKEERIKILFPTQPELVDGKGPLPPQYIATDSDGITFALSSWYPEQINHDFFDASFRFMVDILEKSSSSKVISYTAQPINNGTYKKHVVIWEEDGQLMILNVLKTSHYVYFLEVTAKDEIFRDLDQVEIGSEAFEKMMKVSLKSGTFANSFIIEEASN